MGLRMWWSGRLGIRGVVLEVGLELEPGAAARAVDGSGGLRWGIERSEADGAEERIEEGAIFGAKAGELGFEMREVAGAEEIGEKI